MASNGQKPSGEQVPIDLSTRLALRLSEAAAALGVSERTFRTMRPHVPKVQIGDTTLIPVDALRAWLTSQAKVEGDEIDDVTREVLSELR